ncbi:hypothetical protein WQ56_08740 [Luteimonas sp. FCS-9]|nr:hypothetical protein WQ56_08740 [Luteimonas sp. FCS-9]
MAACERNPLQAGADALDAAQATQARQARNGKVNAYVSCFNAMDGDVRKGVAVYGSWMQDPQAGPRGDEAKAFGPGHVPRQGLDQCAGPVDRVLTAEPALPALDTAVVRFRDAAKALEPLFEEASRYYADDGFRQDAFAQGKRMHPPLMAAITAYGEASDALSSQLQAQIEGEQRARIAALEQSEGRTADFYHLSLMADAKSLVERMAERTFDVAAAERELDAFDALAEEARAQVATQDGMADRWASFNSGLDDLRRVARARIERTRAGTPYTQDEQRMLDNPASGLAPRGSARAVLEAYNGLVERANRL